MFRIKLEHSSEAWVTQKARTQTFAEALQNQRKANRRRGWGNWRGHRKNYTGINFLLVSSGDSRYLRVSEKETKLLLMKPKSMLSFYPAEADAKATHRERGCGPGLYSFMDSGSIRNRVCGWGDPSQEGQGHVDAFWHPSIQSKLRYMGQIPLKWGMEVTPYPFSVSLSLSSLFFAFSPYYQILG